MDYYQTLGVGKTASPDEIKKAYRKLASQHHPDRGGDTATFQKIQTAYDTLSDPEKRQQYDNPMPQGMNGFPNGFEFHTNGFNINDIFEQMFGGRVRPNRQPHKQVFRTQVAVTLEDAYNGISQTLKLQTPTGLKVINIDIPRGTGSGDQIRYENLIENATLLVEFVVIPHLKFDRNGINLFSNQPISVLDLITGTSFEFTTISGKTLEVTVKPKTQPHMQLKIPGQGMPIPNTNTYGDQIILLKPFIPDIIDESIVQSILNSKVNK